MKKFHTLPGVTPRVGVAEGRGAFARWSLTAGAALLLLLSTEGARGAEPTPSPTPTSTVAELDKRVDELKAVIAKLEKQKREIDESPKGKMLREIDPKQNEPAIELMDIEGSLARNREKLSAAIDERAALKVATQKEYETPQSSPATPGDQSASGLGGSAQTRGIFTANIAAPRKPNSSFTVDRPSQIGSGSGGTAPSSSGNITTGGNNNGNQQAAYGSAPTPTNAPSSGTTASGGQSTTAYTSKKDWKTGFDTKRKKKQGETNADPCYVSSELGESQGGIYKCAGTNRALENAKYITGGAVVAGTASMAIKNQTAVNQALQSGSQSGNLDAQASIQAGQEDISKTIGTIQMVQALMLESKADSHGKNIRQLEGNLVNQDAVKFDDKRVNRSDPNNQDATAALKKFVNEKSVSGVDLFSGTGPTQDIGVGWLTKPVDPDGPNLLETTGKAVADDLNEAVKTVGQAAVDEQKDIRDKANDEAKSMFQQAAIAFTVAEQARKNKETLRTAAQNVKQVEKSTKDLAFQFAPNDRSPNQLAAPTQSLSLSSAQDASQSKTDGLGQNGTDEPGETPNFGAPFGAPTDPIPQPSPQPVGDFQRNPGGGGGGGGGGAGGGTSTQPSNNDDDHGGGGGSTYYKLANNKDQYSAGGGGGVGGGGGGGNAGMDFTGMLSQFLPKAEDQGPKNGILDFGARAPAQTALPSSLLDASANLFERVHEAYQSKNRKGQVGQASGGGQNP